MMLLLRKVLEPLPAHPSSDGLVSRRRQVLAGVVVVGLATAPVEVGAQGSEMDRAALVELYNATDGPNWLDNTNWLTDAPLSEWHGVATDEDGRVTSLRLLENQLSGPIPSSLGSLINLQSLLLWRNQLSGPIPGSLGSLSNLDYLNLHGNRLSGTIPDELGSLANLEHMYLHDNRLTGPIPGSLGSLASLQTLQADTNQLTGPIPGSLGSLANLGYLVLHRNQLTGPIPSSLGSLALHSLSLRDNQFSGSIPSWLGNVPSLVQLSLSQNEFSGSIPSTLGRLTNLELLSLSDNNLSGPIPTPLANLSDLRGLWLSPGNEELCAPNDAGFLTWLESIAILRWTGPTCVGETGPPPKPPAVVQQAVDDAVAAATDGEGLSTGDAPVTVRLDALFTFPSAAASAVTYAGMTFSVSSTVPGVVSVSTSTTDAGPAVELTPGMEGGTATVTVDARPQGQPDAAPLASVMFQVEVARAPSTDSTLAGLVLSDGVRGVALTPTFDPATQSYTATVANSVTSVTVTATVADDSATVTVNGAAVESGSPSEAIDLEIGENIIRVVVTAEDGATSSTYSMTVTRATAVPALPLGGALLLGILLVCLGGRRLLQGSTS